jgi:hypothetical protein
MRVWVNLYIAGMSLNLSPVQFSIDRPLLHGHAGTTARLVRSVHGLGGGGALIVQMILEDPMANNPLTVDNLMKVSLNIHTDSAPEGVLFTFVYGTGAAGITPFEKSLYGKSVGDQIELSLDPAGGCEAVGHLISPLREQTGIVPPASLKMTIDDVSQADNREIVRAMATGGSCGGDCDCGCGGHS